MRFFQRWQSLILLNPIDIHPTLPAQCLRPTLSGLMGFRGTSCWVGTCSSSSPMSPANQYASHKFIILAQRIMD